MDFRKTEEQELLLASLRELVARHMPEGYMRKCSEEHKEPVEMNKIYYENGFLTLGLPEEYGGAGADVLTMCMVTEELAILDAPQIVDKALPVDDILHFGSEEQKRITMDLLKEGLPPFCLGITEPQAGSDNNAMTTTATRRNGKVYINGVKTFCSSADTAPYMMCMTRDLESKKRPAESVSMWLVPMNSPGIKLEYLPKIGITYNKMYTVYLEDVELEESALIGEENKGWANLMKNFETERLLAGALCMGIAQGCYNDAVNYANQRVQFGQAIGSFQLIQKKLTDMAIKIENMRNMVYKTAWEVDHGISVKLSSSMVKLYCTQAAFEVADDAMQVLGGIGYCSDSRVSRYWRDVRCNRIGGGTDEVQIYIIGRELLKQAAAKQK